MKGTFKFILITLFFSLIMFINPLLLFAQPSIPGFAVQTYANVSQPVSLSFEPSGFLYVGNGNWPSKIYRIGAGGSPIWEYGDIPLPDPDAVVFDAAGTISGQSGSVLVGGIDGPNSPTGYLSAILPDEITITIFGPGSGLVNPTDMIFDDGGRLLIADAFAAKVFYSDDGITLNTIIGSVYLAGELAIDESGNIYVSRHMVSNPISKYSPEGTLLDGSFVTGLDIHGMDFGPSSPPWDGHLFAVSYEGKLYRIDEMGTATEIGTGFHTPPGDPDLEFGPDGAMYVSDSGDNVIYRIAPACSGMPVTILGTDGHDVINGTEGPDVIHGLGGFDWIRGLGGNDVICGGDGSDVIGAGSGDDIVLGGDGHDAIWGGSGNDSLEGGDGNDSIFGGPGSDEVWGNFGNDSLYGLAGDDKLYGGWGPNDGSIDNNDTCYDVRWTHNWGCEVFYEE